MEQLLNLTPHTINVGNKSYPSVGVARVVAAYSPAGEFNGIPLVTREFGKVEGLPDPQPGCRFIVSAMVADAAKDRTDLFCPGELVRDADGRVIGCKNLVTRPGNKIYIESRVYEDPNSVGPCSVSPTQEWEAVLRKHLAIVWPDVELEISVADVIRYRDEKNVVLETPSGVSKEEIQAVIKTAWKELWEL